jgi:hypothetical protein
MSIQADLIAVYNGFVQAGLGRSAIDNAGIFGPAGQSLVGDHAVITWTYSSNCNCIGVNDPDSPLHLYDGYAYPSPVTDVTLTINQHTFDFMPLDYGIVRLPNNGSVYYPPSFFSFQAEGPPGIISTFQGGTIDGAFSINRGTDGLFGPLSAGVPAPDIGTSLPGAIIALAVLAWWLWRRYGPTARGSPDCVPIIKPV